MEATIPTTSDIRTIIENIDNEDVRYAFMYQFLIGGEVAEICGPYAPDYNNAQEVNFNLGGFSFPAVIFIVNNIKPEDRGKNRICAIPLDTEFEPWAKPLYNWFKKHGDEYPIKYSMRNHQRYAGIYFKDLSWLKEKYRKVERRISPFRLADLRKLRIKNLKEFYHFDEVDLALSCAWNEKPRDALLSYQIENVLKTSIDIDDLNIVKKRAEKYVSKLLRPINQLGEEKYDVYYLSARKNTELIDRREKAIRISHLIRDTNILSEAAFGDQFLIENMRTMLEFFDPCNSESDYIIKILSLASLFEVNMKSLQTQINVPNDLGSIRLVERWLIENNVDYDEKMIETWLNIKKLRNMEPVHSRIDAIELKKILEFFGVKITRPQNYALLWDQILDRYRISLEQWRELLNKINA